MPEWAVATGLGRPQQGSTSIAYFGLVRPLNSANWFVLHLHFIAISAKAPADSSETEEA